MFEIIFCAPEKITEQTLDCVTRPASLKNGYRKNYRLMVLLIFEAVDFDWPGLKFV